MPRIVVLYATTDGQTGRIARHVAAALSSEGAEAQVVDAAAPPPGFSLVDADAAVVAGSIRMGRHQRALTRLVRSRAAELAGIPGAFLSVSLSAARATDPARRDVRKCIERFIEGTGWTPDTVLPVAGALQYSRYGFFLKRVMRFIYRANGGDTDMSRDYEYTDWDRLTSFAQGFARALGQRAESQRALEALSASAA
jgi:menaquinone-dependent protoporphyrinogen oxidase